MQEYAGIYLLQNYSTCSGCSSHLSSGVHNVAIWPRWRKVVAHILRPVSEAAFAVLCNPDDGCDGHPKHVE